MVRLVKGCMKRGKMREMVCVVKGRGYRRKVIMMMWTKSVYFRCRLFHWGSSHRVRGQWFGGSGSYRWRRSACCWWKTMTPLVISSLLCFEIAAIKVSKFRTSFECKLYIFFVMKKFQRCCWVKGMCKIHVYTKLKGIVSSMIYSGSCKRNESSQIFIYRVRVFIWWVEFDH